jgi:L-ascorbate metabolism protein UlaG (beta-lactamase superfamily)
MNLSESVEPYRPCFLAASEGPVAPGEVAVTWWGTNALLIEDGMTRLMIDPYFSRWPGLLGPGFLCKKIAPDQAAMDRGLARAGIDRLDAVLITHSHFDHVLDAGEVALRTGATLVGSASAANVGRGAGLAEDRLNVVEAGRPLRFGDFTVTFLPGRHLPFPWFLQWLLGGEKHIQDPLRPPVGAGRYKVGAVHSILIEHPAGVILNQGSAGMVPGALDGIQADAVLLGIGGLDMKSNDYQKDYYRASVEAVGARLVVPTHWDDFQRPLDEPVRLLRRIHRVLDRLLGRAGEWSGPPVRLPPLGRAIRLLPLD